MFNRYYQQELQNLRDLAGEFSKRHPAAAPMLSNQSADPDVERLLEGVAFLTGNLIVPLSHLIGTVCTYLEENKTRKD